jgi:hypothetical protein
MAKKAAPKKASKPAAKGKDSMPKPGTSDYHRMLDAGKKRDPWC